MLGFGHKLRTSESESDAVLRFVVTFGMLIILMVSEDAIAGSRRPDGPIGQDLRGVVLENLVFSVILIT